MSGSGASQLLTELLSDAARTLAGRVRLLKTADVADVLGRSHAWVTPTPARSADFGCRAAMSGASPRGVAQRLNQRPDHAVWGEALLALTASRDLVIVNLECCLAIGGRPTRRIPRKPFFFRGPR